MSTPTGKSEKSKDNTQLAYWCKLFENFAFSVPELYDLVEKNLKEREVPALAASRLLMRESGPFSPERLYLQLRRERLVFEIGAASFGTGFFVSSRLFDRRREAGFLEMLRFTAALLLVAAPFTYAAATQSGWVAAVIVFTGILAVVWTLMRLATLESLAWLDRFLSELPVIGPVYDRVFRPDTYYRQDLNASYRAAVHNAVMQAVDEMCGQKGLKVLTEDERKPFLRDVHQR